MNATPYSPTLPKKPKAVLLIQSDQHRWDCLGINGHPQLKTPNLDRIATEGINFTNAFCTTPMCVPTRCSYLTGKWPQQHGVICNWDGEGAKQLPTTSPTFAWCLHESGIATDYIGRWHVNQQHDPTAFGFDTFTNEWMYNKWRKEQDIPPLKKENSYFGGTDTAITPEQSQIAWNFNKAIEKFEQRTKDGFPFFLRLDLTAPHIPNYPPEPYASMYDPEELEPWGSFADPLKNKPYIQKQQQHTWKVNDWQWKDWAPVVAKYLGDITLLDHQLGHLLDKIDELGMTEDTLIIYTSDHGDMCGAHGMIDKHYVMYDDVMRVPLLMRWPGVIQPSSTCDSFISNAIDLCSTFCDVFHTTPHEEFNGHSILSSFLGKPANDRQDIFSSWNGNQFGQFSQRMVRDRRWKYTWNATDVDELYDLENDPHEITNLASIPEHQEELQRLRKRLISWMEKTDDKLLNPWTRSQLEEGNKI